MGDKRAERLQIMLTHQEIQALDAWRFDHRMPTRSAAARALMNLGLKAPTSPTAAQDKAGDAIASQDIAMVQDDEAGVDLTAKAPQVLIAMDDVIAGHGLAHLVEN